MLNKGFEITDESYYVLLSHFSKSTTLFISAQQFVSSFLWQLTGSLTSFRASGLIVLILSSLLLSMGSISFAVRLKIISDDRNTQLSIIASTALASLLYGSTINFSPSYNLIGSAGAYAGLGLCLLGINQTNPQKKFFTYILSGIAIAIIMLCKGSAGITIFGLTCAYIGYFESPFKNKFFGSLCTGIGLLIGLIFFIKTNTDLNTLLSNLEQGMKLFKVVQTEHVSDRLLRYVSDYFTALASAYYLAIPFTFFVLFLLIKKRILAVISFISLGYIIINKEFFLGGFDRYVFQAQILTVFILNCFFIFWSEIRSNRNVLFFLSALFILPYAVGMGTGNTLFTQAIISLASWGVIIGITAQKNISACINGILFSLMLASQLISSGFRAPYGLGSPLIDQTSKAHVSLYGQLLVDRETKKFISDLNEAKKKCNISPGKPYFGLYNLPGVAAIFEAEPLLTPWLYNREQAEFVLKMLDQEVINSSIIALNIQGESPRLPPQISDALLNFTFCGEAIYPYHHQKIQIWIRI